MRIRLATFDALYTILRPRQPVHVQYADVFAPYLGTLPPDAVKSAFKDALTDRQTPRPTYEDGPVAWWTDIISRTALGAGARKADVNEHLPTIVPQLLYRFSSREGYALYDDSIRSLKALRALGVQTAIISNTDERILLALNDLGAFKLFDLQLVSSLECIEKPDREIFHRACERAGVRPDEAVHIGDEMVSDYKGARDAGLNALLLRRPPEELIGYEEENDGGDEDRARCVKSLDEVVKLVREVNI